MKLCVKRKKQENNGRTNTLRNSIIIVLNNHPFIFNQIEPFQKIKTNNNILKIFQFNIPLLDRLIPISPIIKGWSVKTTSILNQDFNKLPAK